MAARRFKIKQGVDAVQFQDPSSLVDMRKVFGATVFDSATGFIEPHKSIVVNSPCGTLVALTGDWIIMFPGNVFWALKQLEFETFFKQISERDEHQAFVKSQADFATAIKNSIEVDEWDIEKVLAHLDMLIKGPDKKGK